MDFPMEVAVIGCEGNSSSSISIWNAFNGTLISTYHGEGSCTPHGLVASGGYVISNERGKPMIRAWPLNKQRYINKRLIAPGKISCIDVSPDSCYLALGVESKLHVYQISSGIICGVSNNHFQPLTVVRFNREGTLIASAGEDGLLSVWNLAQFIQKGSSTKSPVFTVHGHSLPITDFLFTSTDMMSYILSCSLDHSCKMFNLSSKKCIFNGVFENQLTCLALSPAETCFFVGDSIGKVYEVSLIDPPRSVDNHYLKTSSKVFGVHEKSVTALSCSMDCSLLLSASLDKTVKLSHIKSRYCLITINLKDPALNCFFYITPQTMHHNSFVPSLQFHDFINNIDNLDYFSFNVNVKESLFHDESVVSNSASDRTLTEEIERVKNINRQLYRCALRGLLEHEHTKR